MEALQFVSHKCTACILRSHDPASPASQPSMSNSSKKKLNPSSLSPTTTTTTCPRHCNIPNLHGLIQSKKATLVLIWSGIIHFFYIRYIATPSPSNEDYKYYPLIGGLLLGLLLILYPFSGWIADVYLTRYWTMFIGQWIVAVGSLLTTLLRFLAPQVELVGLFVAATGQALFEVNAIQFGLDQLQTHSTDNHRYYIYWYYWTMELGHFLFGGFACTGSGSAESIKNSINVTSAVFSVIQILFIILIAIQVLYIRKRLYHHQTGPHPFRLIFQILAYSRKARSPSHPLSAFQYTDNETPSCLDRAKFKYGGPFTTEQVEDVKVFFYILLLLVPLSAIYFFDELKTIAYQFIDNEEGLSYGDCLLVEVPSWLRSAIAFILVPLYIFVLSRFMNRCSYHTSLLWRLGLALCLTLAGVLTLFSLQLNVTLNKIHTTNNSTMLVQDECDSRDFLDYRLLVLPEFLNSLSYVIIFSTTLEFICAQSPYRTKGLLIGIWFSFHGIDNILLGLQRFFELSCILGYYIAKALLMIGIFVLFLFSARRYRYRRRQDKDVRTIIEEYYSEKHDDDEEESVEIDKQRHKQYNINALSYNAI